MHRLLIVAIFAFISLPAYAQNSTQALCAFFNSDTSEMNTLSQKRDAASNPIVRDDIQNQMSNLGQSWDHQWMDLYRQFQNHIDSYTGRITSMSMFRNNVTVAVKIDAPCPFVVSLNFTPSKGKYSAGATGEYMQLLRTLNNGDKLAFAGKLFLSGRNLTLGVSIYDLTNFRKI